MFDARRMEVYTMVLNEKKEVLKPTFAEIITENSFDSFPKDKKWIFMGEGAQKCKTLLNAPHIDYRERRSQRFSRKNQKNGEFFPIMLCLPAK